MPRPTRSTPAAAAAPAKKRVAAKKKKVAAKKKKVGRPAPSVYDMVGAPKVYTHAEVTRMSPEQLTDAINREAVRLLHTKDAITKTTIPFKGDQLRNNPFATALLAEVPDERYKQANVWRTKADGSIEFAEWLWRVGTVRAINRFAANYDSTKKPSDPAFPREEFGRQLRQVRNRGHKRKGHEREREQAAAQA